MKNRLKYYACALFLMSVALAQTGARYLVITPDYFYSTLQPLIEWKYKKGMKPAVYKTSQIGTDTASIHAFIVNCYTTWDIKPEYVILVGHPGYIPMCYYPYASSHYYTDNYYGNVDGDIYNEILPGRLSVADTIQLKTVINKILVYERFPFMDDSSWFKRGCAMANCNYDPDSVVYLSDMRYAESLAVSNGFVHVDTFSDHNGYNETDVINAINDGRMFVQYRGNANNHWYPPFDVDPYNCANGAELPVILSTTCRTVSSSGTPILGENFLRVGTPTSPRGAVAFYGGTRNTGGASELRSAVVRGFLDAIFIDGTYTFGKAGENGRLRVYQMFGEIREYNNFTCLGDPELNLWTETPRAINVQHPQYISVGCANFVVNVSSIESALPVSNAAVCVAAKNDSSTYVLDTTDVTGNAYFTVYPLINDDTVFVTVTGRNLMPYEGYMITKMFGDCYVVYLKSTVNDSAAGNNDGFINPNESIELPTWVHNLGESTGVDVSGTLRSYSPYVQVTDSVKTYGNINGHDSAYTGQDGYNFNVASFCPNNTIVSFELTCRDVNDSVWVSFFSDIVYAPDLCFEECIVSGGNGNAYIEPAETVGVSVALRNLGGVAVDSAQAILRCSNTDVYVLDSMGTYGHNGIDSVAQNTSDSFAVAIDSGVAVGTAIDFEMTVLDEFSCDTVNFVVLVGRTNYFVWNPDPSPQSGQIIHTLLTGLGYEGEYGTALPQYLELYQSIFVCCGVYSNRYLIDAMSSEADALVGYLLNGGRVYLESSSAWFIDPEYFNGYNFAPVFGIYATTWSYGDLGPLVGQSNTFTSGMNFSYNGENAYMDHTDPSGGYVIFRDGDNYYNCAVAYDAGSYRTVGTSFELGGLVDGVLPSTREALLDSIMRFFGIPAPGIEEKTDAAITSFSPVLEILSPNPFAGSIRLSGILPGSVGTGERASLQVADVTGRIIKQYDLASDNNTRSFAVVWDGTDSKGRSVSAGVYFIKLVHGLHSETKKVVMLK